MFQIHATLTPRDAQRTIWNRTVNNRGGLGNNVPLDLDLEHDNHLLKDIIIKLLLLKLYLNTLTPST